MRVLLFDPAHLDQHYDEHDEVEKENDTEIGDHSHVEGNVISQPAAVEKDKDERQSKG